MNMAMNCEKEQSPKRKTGIRLLSCQEHVTHALKIVYLPHIKKVLIKECHCAFCKQRAIYQFFSLP
jgi:hypothetical protein